MLTHEQQQQAYRRASRKRFTLAAEIGERKAVQWIEARNRAAPYIGELLSSARYGASVPAEIHRLIDDARDPLWDSSPMLFVFQYGRRIAMPE